MRQTAERRGANRSRGQAGPLGYVLIFAMILGGTTVVLVTGGMALSDAQDTAEAQRAEHTMTLFDSRAAMVALGESGAQSISFGQDSGVFETRPTEGYLAIRHSEWESGEPSVELYNETLGSVVYENGERELAYQGGGVWRLDAEGEARIISPPEFHYRGATLTLPVVRVDGNASGAGSVTARITGSTRAEKVYPDASETYPAPASSRQYLNPIRNGEVSVFVRSDYYQGWATYFRQRTQGNVTVFDENRTVKVKLKSIGGAPGEFDMPLEGNSLEVSGFGENHPLTDFSLTLKGDNKDFNNGQWSLYSMEGGDEFEMHVEFEDKCNGGSYGGYIDFSVYYYNSTTGVSHEWQNDSIDPDDTTTFDVDCANTEVTVDLTSVDTNLTYQDIDVSSGSDNKWCFGSHINDRDVPPSITLDDHSPVDGSMTFDENTGNHTMNYVVNHYMERVGLNYELTVKDGPGNSECLSGGAGSGSSRIVEGQSSGVLRYSEATGAQYITYLHVTDNEINVSIDS